MKFVKVEMRNLVEEKEFGTVFSWLLRQIISDFFAVLAGLEFLSVD